MDNLKRLEQSWHCAAKKRRRIMVIGCGRWGSFIGWYLDHIGHDVTLYGREGSRHLEEFRKTRSNGMITLEESTKLTSDLSQTKEADIIVISIPSQNLDGLMGQLEKFALGEKIFVLCMKGIEISTGRRLTQVTGQHLGLDSRTAVWIGPGHVQEFFQGIPNCMVIDSGNDEVKHELVDLFTSSLIRFYYGDDLIGNEIGAAAKNVIGIAAGMLDGEDLSSLKGALMARGTREISRLIAAMGGNELSAYGLCHLGDYEATVFSRFSHNRQFGESFIKGEKFTSLAEGYYTVKALVQIGERMHVDLPICNAVYRILYEKADPGKELGGLFHRSLKSEFYGTRQE